METFLKRVTLHENMTVKDILSFYEATKKFNVKCQLLCSKHVVETTSLPKLVSFFLTAGSKQDIQIKLEGTQANSFWKSLVSNKENSFLKAYNQNGIA
ncbi:hypothetical protein CEQ21_09705 [Niallia circulans]|uniref:Uncharacterized protein n=1 Tax=Niallia circulans TaxID=1397 RepID=A0A553SFX8_NIACI|nr:hypothetical protein [Niallia circulans]TRZ35892.1 hypothetical protein CEQ21_09705 [Niallia circulans]